MKYLKIITFLLIALSLNLSAQEIKPTYKAHAKGWLVDVNEAYAESQKTGKPILANFTGSDWCGWCHKIKREIFDTDEFKTWAAANVVLLEVDFPRSFKLPENIQQQNRSLQQAFQVTGYPTIWAFNLTKNEGGQFMIQGIGKTGYMPSTAAFTNNIDAMILASKKK